MWSHRATGDTPQPSSATPEAEVPKTEGPNAEGPKDTGAEEAGPARPRVRRLRIPRARDGRSGERLHTTPPHAWWPRLRAALPRRGRRRWAVAAVLLAALPAALVVVLSGNDPASARPLTADYARTATWDGGFSAQYVLHNPGGGTVDGWTLRFRLPDGADVANLWNGRLAREGGWYVVTGQDWNRSLKPGEYVVVGLQAHLESPEAPTAPTVPGDCTINNRPCAGISASDRPAGQRVPHPSNPLPAVRPRPTTPVHATGPSPAPSTADVPGTSANPPAQPAATPPSDALVAPYVDVSLAGPDLSSATAAGDVHAWTLATVVDGGSCSPMWGGVTALTDPSVAGRVTALRARGDDVGVSFGGTAGTDLAATCATPQDLAAAYQSVVDAYGITRIDLDVSTLARPDVVDRRNQALRILQDDATRQGRRLEVTYTLPVSPQGLGDDALALLRNADRNGVDVGLVNVMAMDYGAQAAPQPDGGMGRYATQALLNTFGQVRSLWPALTDDQVWGRLGVTPMIGANNVPGEVFTLDDARLLVQFAHDHHVGLVSWWSASRDQPCGPGATPPASGADPTCSGVDQAPYAYLTVLSTYG